MYSPIAAQTSSIASAESRPERSTPRPSRVTRLRRSTGETRPPSTSATSNRDELVPTSIAATLCDPSAIGPALYGPGQPRC